jgi:hypothetical protein
MHDPQQKRVYRWEDGFRSFLERTATRSQVRELIRKASKQYGIEAPRVTFKTKAGTTGRITSEYDPEEHAISIGWHDCNHAIALHECAHAIADTLHGQHLQPHGKEWLGIYLWLLQWAGVAPKSALVASAREKRLKWRESRIPARRAKRKGK